MPSGWGTLAAGVGAAMTGGANAYQQEQDRKTREKLAQQTNDVKLLLERVKGDNRNSLEVQRQQGREALRGLVNAGNVDVQRLKNEGQSYVRELQNQGMLDVEDVRAISRLNLKNIDQEIAAGHDATSLQVGAGHDAASVTVGAGHDAASRAVGAGHDTASEYGADMRYSGATDVANINQEGQTGRADADRPLKIFRANQGRYPRGNAAAKRAGSVSTPTFGPSYSDFMQQGGVPGPAMPDQFAPPATNFSPAPKADPYGFGAAMPSALPPPSAAPAAAARPSLSDFVGPQQPAAAAGKSPTTVDRVEQQANDLMARITQAQQAGKFDQVRALKQQLADLVKQQQ